MPSNLDPDIDVAWRMTEVMDGADGVYAGDVLTRAHRRALATDMEQLGGEYRYSDISAGYVHEELGRRPDVRPHRPRASLAEDEDLAERLEERTYPELGDDRIMIVGAGAASLLLSSYLTMRGAAPENITIADPRGSYGGTWQDAWKQAGGFNNPRALRFSPDRKLKLRDRSGYNMEDFLRQIARDRLYGVDLLPEKVLKAKRGRDGSWRTTTADGQKQSSDYLVLATGVSTPRPIDGRRLRSNLDRISGKVHPSRLIYERYQRRLKYGELASGRPIVLIGLGNSTAAMAHQIQQYEDEYGVSVDYTVVTDHSRDAIHYPKEAIDGNKAIYRDPDAGTFTGYSGDLRRDRKVFKRMRKEGRIITGATDVYFDPDTDQFLAVTDSAIHRIEKPHVFALLGYDRDPTLFRKIGAMGRFGRQDTPDIRPSDGAVRTRKDGYASNAFAIGSVAATPLNPNAAVIPGILSQIPATTMTMGVRSMVRQAEAG